MQNNNKPKLGLKIGYYLPAVIAIYAVIAACVVVLLTMDRGNDSGLLSKLIHLVLNFLYYLLIDCWAVLLPIGIAITIVVVTMIIATIQYQRGNTLINYFYSIIQTQDFRKFCRLVVPNDSNNAAIVNAFNLSLKSMYVDIRSDSITVWILIPTSQEAKQILDNKMNDIVQKVKQNNPDYTFSEVQLMENSNFYCLQGSKLTD